MEKPCGLHCIHMKDISVTADGKTIIENVNLHLHCGRLSVIIGRNGAGKTTLLKAILGELPHTGEIIFHDQKKQTVSELKIGYVPQKINIDREAPVSVYDFIVSFQKIRPVFLWKKKKEYQQIRKQLARFGGDQLIDEPIGKLSGGELQRVLLALALIETPNLLILDEPVSGIDKAGKDLFYEIISELRSSYDMAIILVSHDLDYTAAYADEVILLDGHVLERGSAKKVYASENFRNVFGNLSYDVKQYREGEEELACTISTD